MNIRSSYSRYLSLFLVCSFAFNGCASQSAISYKDKSPEVRFFSDLEAHEGLVIHEEMLSHFYLYTEPEVVAYVNAVAENLAGAAPQNKKSYEVYLLHNEFIYAKSAPGGYIYITTGMVNFLENEAELAAVIAKEIGVLQFQDPSLNGNKVVLDESARFLAGLAPIFGIYGMLATLAVVAGHQVIGKKIAPEDKDRLVSDELAMRYMVAANYDPQGFIDLTHRFIKADKGKRPLFHDYYTTNPITEERFLKMNEIFSKLPLKNKSLSVNHDEFLNKTRGIREIYRVA